MQIVQRLCRPSQVPPKSACDVCASVIYIIYSIISATYLFCKCSKNLLNDVFIEFLNDVFDYL